MPSDALIDCQSDRLGRWGLSYLQSTTTTLTDHHLFLNSLSVMPAAGELNQLGALLWREYLCNVPQGSDKPLGSRIRQLQFGVTDVPERRTINGRLCQHLQQCLPVLVMLFAHLRQVLDG